MKDAITLITDEHRQIEKLFREFADRVELAHPSKQRIALSICELLLRHTRMEEHYFYPRLKNSSPPEETKLIEEAYAEHTVAQQLITEIGALLPNDQQFDAKMTVLKENVLHHVKEEENELLPKAKDILSENELEELGTVMERYKTSLV